MIKNLSHDKIYEYIAIGLTVLAVVYLSLFVANEYYTLHEYTDLAIFANNIYFNIHYPQIAHGLQFILFGNHISPDMLLIIPIFYLHQSSLTLLLIELIFVYVGGIAVFYITRDLTKNSLVALILCVAFLIYPGTLGQVVFDAHIEFPITIFYLLTFYFYMKRKPYKFLVSSLLLLGSAEVTPILGLFLGIGLLVYEYRYNKGNKLSNSRKAFAISLIILSLLAALFYSYVTQVLLHNPSYANIPPIFSIANGLQQSLPSHISNFISNPISQISYDISLYFHSYRVYLVYSILLILFGFGISLFFSPEIAFLLIIPWLSGVFIFQDSSFLFPLSEYFSYVVSPIICASIIGILASKEKDNRLSQFLRNAKINASKLIIGSVIIGSVFLSILSPIIYLYLLSPSSAYHSVNKNNIGQLLFFYSNQTQLTYYKQLYSVINKVPANGSVLAEYFIMAHLITRESVDAWPNRLTSPDYIIVDFNSDISPNMCKTGFENCTEYENLINSKNYTILFQNGTAILYRKI